MLQCQISTCFRTLAAVVRLSTGDPLSTLKPPVVRVRQHHLHKHVVVRCQTETSYVKTKKWEHPSANTEQNKFKT